jgi:hypothetical protein
MKRLLVSLVLIGTVYSGYEFDPPEPKLDPHSLAQEPAEPQKKPLNASAKALASIQAPRPSPLRANRTLVRLAALRPNEGSSTDAMDQELSGSGADEARQPSLPLPSERQIIWVGVLRAAKVHSGPSVSAPTIWHFPVGIALQQIGYERGWFQVSDPATSRQGWIYWKYLGAFSGPIEARVTPEEPPSSIQEDSARGKPLAKAKKHRPAARTVKQPKTKKQQRIAERVPRVRRDGMAGLLARALQYR